MYSILYIQKFILYCTCRVIIRDVRYMRTLISTSRALHICTDWTRRSEDLRRTLQREGSERVEQLCAQQQTERVGLLAKAESAADPNEVVAVRVSATPPAVPSLKPLPRCLFHLLPIASQMYEALIDMQRTALSTLFAQLDRKAADDFVRLARVRPL